MNKTYSTFLTEAKVTRKNFDKTVSIFVRLFERKMGTKLYRFGGASGYTEIKGGIGILYFYNQSNAIRFNYVGGEIESLTLWDSYKLGKKGDRTISFKEIGLTQAGYKLIDIIKKDILEFLKETNSTGKLKDISMRTYVAAEDLYKSGLANWKELLGYV